MFLGFLVFYCLFVTSIFLIRPFLALKVSRHACFVAISFVGLWLLLKTGSNSFGASVRHDIAYFFFFNL